MHRHIFIVDIFAFCGIQHDIIQKAHMIRKEKYFAALNFRRKFLHLILKKRILTVH